MTNDELRQEFIKWQESTLAEYPSYFDMYAAGYAKRQEEIKKLEDNVILLHEEHLKKDYEIAQYKALLRECSKAIDDECPGLYQCVEIREKLKQAGYGNE